MKEYNLELKFTIKEDGNIKAKVDGNTELPLIILHEVTKSYSKEIEKLIDEHGKLCTIKELE